MLTALIIREKQTNTDNLKDGMGMEQLELSSIVGGSLSFSNTVSTKVRQRLAQWHSNSPYDTIIPLLYGIYLKEIWTHAPKDIHSSIINNSPKMRQLKSTDKSITIYWFSEILNSNINEQTNSTHNHPNEPHKHSVERCQAQRMHNV